MVLSPLPVSKAAHAVVGVVAAAVAVGLLLDRPVPRLSRAAAFVLLAGAVVVLSRCPRLGVRCDARGVTVHGLLWSRTVPRSAVDEVTDFPALRWRTPDGRRRWTPVTFLPTSGRALPVVLRHDADQVQRLRRWVRHR